MFLSVRNGAKKTYSKVLQFAWIRNTCKLLRKMEASKTVKKKDIVLSSIYLQSRPLHLKQKKMISRTLQKNLRKPTVFFRNETRACVIRKHGAPAFTDLYSQAFETWETADIQWKQKNIGNIGKRTANIRNAIRSIGNTSERHRKDIGKASERKLWPLKMHLFWRPARTRASERHRKGIEKHLETLESIGKHRKASENIGPPLEEPEQGWKLPLSFGLVDLQYKAAALETFGDCSFLYFNSLLVCSAVKVDRMLVTN